MVVVLADEGRKHVVEEEFRVAHKSFSLLGTKVHLSNRLGQEESCIMTQSFFFFPILCHVER